MCVYFNFYFLNTCLSSDVEPLDPMQQRKGGDSGDIFSLQPIQRERAFGRIGPRSSRLERTGFSLKGCSANFWHRETVRLSLSLSLKSQNSQKCFEQKFYIKKQDTPKI